VHGKKLKFRILFLNFNGNLPFAFLLFTSYFVLSLLSGCAHSQAITKICFSDYCVQAEVCDTFEKRSLGLMFRESLLERKGMLFVFPQEEVYNFWMKNMRVSLDMIWVSSGKMIVDIKENVPPCIQEPCEIIRPGAKALYVVEVVSGFAKKHKLKIGDLIKFKYTPANNR
jgi:uncharacterized membrane protein (UPF0127 family)